MPCDQTSFKDRQKQTENKDRLIHSVSKKTEQKETERDRKRQNKIELTDRKTDNYTG